MNINQFNNARLQLIKDLIVNEPTITDNEIYEEVCKWIDNTTFEDYTSKQFDKNTGKVTYKKVRPIPATGKAMYELQQQLIQEAAQYRTFNLIHKAYVDNWQPNPKAFATAVSKLFFNINNHEEALESIRKFFANIQYNLGNTNFNAQQSMLYLLSECVGRCR